MGYLGTYDAEYSSSGTSLNNSAVCPLGILTSMKIYKIVLKYCSVVIILLLFLSTFNFNIWYVLDVSWTLWN